jgi:hypothetical protein
MTPSQLPSGDYELMLRSRQPNGKQATSRRSVAVTVQPSLTDQNTALMTPDKASVAPSKPVVPSAVHHPSRARREAAGPAAQDLSGLRPKLFGRGWRDQGNRDEARNLLAPVYGWFTEGFDTLDLKQAKVLLEEFA